MNEGKDILLLNELWNNTDSNIIADNVEELLKINGYNTRYSCIVELSEITKSNEYTVYAWLNRGRTNVKIPFLKLCTIAEAYGIEVSKLLTGGNYHMKKSMQLQERLGITKLS